MPGISQICSGDLREWGDYWRFTEAGALRLFAEVFGGDNVKLESYGNVFVASAFLQGLAVEDLKTEKLDYRDPAYQISICVRAVKQLVE